MQSDGLLRAGSNDTQLTWMDANADGQPVTPRNGCPVEINALWYNFLCFLGQLPEGMVRNSAAAAALASKVKDSFVSAFWLPEEGYLADLYDNGQADPTIRPNQIFAVSLPNTALNDEQSVSVTDCVRRELYTPLGLRTLSPRDPRFQPVYQGGPSQRDRAYHNGTVWPWLIGHYVEALIRTSQDREALINQIEEILDAFRFHLYRDGIGTISEIFDGGTPRFGRGCPSQAWSVAEVLRVAQMYEKLKQGRQASI